ETAPRPGISRSDQKLPLMWPGSDDRRVGKSGRTYYWRKMGNALADHPLHRRISSGAAVSRSPQLAELAPPGAANAADESAVAACSAARAAASRRRMSGLMTARGIAHRGGTHPRLSRGEGEPSAGRSAGRKTSYRDPGFHNVQLFSPASYTA